MEEKICSICKEKKAITEFNKNKAKKSGLQTHCKKCSKARFKAYWEKNKEKQRKVCKATKHRIVSGNQQKIIDYLKVHPCVDCGETDIIVLEFDHVRGEKEASLCQAVAAAWSWEKLEKEIAKCEVRCSNCHKRKTAKERNSYKFKNMGS